jgi:hypothetical protein
MRRLRNRLIRKKYPFKGVNRVGVYILKFFSALGGGRNFVLYANLDEITKQNISHNSGKPTQPTLLHSEGQCGA